MTRRKATSDLEALLDPATQEAESVTPALPTPIVVVRPPEPSRPAPEAARDVEAEVLLRWFAPLRRRPGQAARPDLIVPYAVLLVAATLARGAPQGTIRTDLVAEAFPQGVAHAAARQLHALGFIHNDPIAGTMQIRGTPVRLR